MSEEYIEKGTEHIPTQEEVLSLIHRRYENVTLVLELSDDLGPYLIETTTGDVESGNYVECLYLRKGKQPNKNETAATTIFAATYEDGQAATGVNIFDYNDTTGEWVEVK
jgi:hypothetical protein